MELNKGRTASNVLKGTPTGNRPYNFKAFRNWKVPILETLSILWFMKIYAEYKWSHLSQATVSTVSIASSEFNASRTFLSYY